MAIQKQEVDNLLSRLTKKEIKFSEVLRFIETHYTHTATAFQNGEQHNAATENQGSAKVLSFALANNLSEEETLQLFAEHYDDVLATPNASNHQNIREFMKSGWDGVQFEGTALTAQ